MNEWLTDPKLSYVPLIAGVLLILVLVSLCVKPWWTVWLLAILVVLTMNVAPWALKKILVRPEELQGLSESDQEKK